VQADDEARDHAEEALIGRAVRGTLSADEMAVLQKHVGDVFPAEVADFPLAEAVRRGVAYLLHAYNRESSTNSKANQAEGL